jgi:hypothetical protein
MVSETNRRKTYGKWNPCPTLPEGAATAPNDVVTIKGCPRLDVRRVQP